MKRKQEQSISNPFARSDVQQQSSKRSKFSSSLKKSANFERAQKRLMKDLLQLQREPLVDITAAPLPNNIFIWHANIRGPKDTVWEGGIFHFIMTFTELYPQDPPKLKLCTRMAHPFVMPDNSICLDMLERHTSSNQKDLAKKKNQGWSSAYTIQSILIQLQAFLFEAEVSRALAGIQNISKYERKKEEWKSAARFSVEQSLNFQNCVCGLHHPPRNCWPKFHSDEEVKQANDSQVKMNELERLKAQLLCFFTRQTFQEEEKQPTTITATSSKAIGASSSTAAPASSSAAAVTTPSSDKSILGYGIKFNKNLRTGEIRTIDCVGFDYISIRAFMNHNLRVSAGNEPFTHWIPIFINEKHGKFALQLAERAMSIICTGTSKNFKPVDQVLQVLPKLIATITVELFNKGSSSLKAFRAICHFHRLFIAFVQKYPELKQKCEDIVKGFISDETKRHKDNLASLGEFLAIASVTGIPWSEIKAAYLNESMTRNIFWMLQKYPQLETLAIMGDDERVKLSFESTRVGQGFSLFNIFFLNQLAPNSKKTLEQVAKQYDERYGFTTPAVEQAYEEFLASVANIKSYKDYFAAVEMPHINDNTTIATMLKEALVSSKQKGYHGKANTVLDPIEYAKQNKLIDFESLVINKETKELHGDEQKWQEMVTSRFGITSLPETMATVDHPWRKLYLQHHVQHTVSMLNETQNFSLAFSFLPYCQELTNLELVMFEPSKLKSKYYFLTLLLSELKNLQTLIIRKGEVGLTSKGFKALIKGLSHAKLKHLILDQCDINAEAVNQLTNSKESKFQSFDLHRLSLSGNPLGDVGASTLAEFLLVPENVPNLVELDLSDCNIGDSGAIKLAEVLLMKRNLKILRFDSNKCLGTGLNSLITQSAYSNSLERLEMSKMKGASLMNDQSVAKMAKLSRSIKVLNLSKVNCTSAHAFQALAENKSITELNLAESGINIEIAYKYLNNNSKVESLNLYKNGITCTSLHNMLDYASKQPERSTQPFSIANLTHVDFAYNNFSAAILPKMKHSIGNFMMVTPRLQSIDLTCSGIDREHLVQIAVALNPKSAPNLAIKKLVLKLNGNIGKTGLKPLVEALQANTRLEELDISGCKLQVAGAAFVANILEVNTGLKKLNLFGNFIEIEGAIMIAKALQKNKTLVDLDLGLNRIRTRGTDSIAELVKTNSTLQRLALKQNHIKDKQALDLATNIVSNPTCALKTVALAGNFLSTAIQTEISSLLTSKKISFDMARLVEVKDAERLERTIYVTPFPKNCSETAIKQFFYEHKCGMILNICVHAMSRISSTSKSKYAFVEFAHADSIKLAVQLVHQKKNRFAGNTLHISKAGVQQHNIATVANQTLKRRRMVNRGRGASARGRRGRGRNIGRGAARRGLRRRRSPVRSPAYSPGYAPSSPMYTPSSPAYYAD